MNFAKLFQYDDIGQVLVTIIDGLLFIYVKDPEGDLLEQIYDADGTQLEDIDEIDTYAEALSLLAAPTERSDLH